MNTKTKRTGDYTLNIGSDRGYKINSIEWATKTFGPHKTFELRTKSAHGEFYDKHIGMVSSFELVNNKTGKKFKFTAGKAVRV